MSLRSCFLVSFKAPKNFLRFTVEVEGISSMLCYTASHTKSNKEKFLWTYIIYHTHSTCQGTLVQEIN